MSTDSLWTESSAKLAVKQQKYLNISHFCMKTSNFSISGKGSREKKMLSVYPIIVDMT